MIRFLKRKGWIIVLILFLALFPQSLSSQARLNNRVLITGLAIDKSSEGYTVTAQVAMPIVGDGSGQSAFFEFITDTGKTVMEALNKTGYKIGKIAGLSHTNFIMLGQGVLEDNLTSDLDYFVREAHMPNSVMIMLCEGKAEDEIKKTKNLELSVGFALQKVFLFKQDALNSIMIPAEKFVDYCYEASHVSVMPVLKIEDAEKEQGGSGEQGAGGESSGESKSARIEYLTPIAYFKNGIYVDKLSSESEIWGYLLAQPFGTTFDLTISNVDDGSLYSNAEVGLKVGHKNTKLALDFSSERPNAKMTIELKDVSILEVKNNGEGSGGIFKNNSAYANSALSEAINNQIRENVSQVFNKAKKQNVDIFQLASHAYKFNNREFKNYLLSQANIDNFLQGFDLEVEVKILNFK